MIKNYLVVFIVFLLFSCVEKEEENRFADFDLLTTWYSGCLGQKSASLDDNVERFVISSIGEKRYQIEHQNVNLNCCLPEGIEINVCIKNDTLFYTDKEKVSGNCRCMCTYNTSAEIGEIADGEYVLCLISGAENIGSVEFNFNDEMYEEIIVSELADYK